MTDCNQSDFEFGSGGKRKVTARFDGGTISSDGGAVLLQETDRRLKLLDRSPNVFSMYATQSSSSIRCARCWRNASTVWRWATKT